MATNLKQFEKWRDEKHTGAGIYTTVALKAGWKAALECVRDKMLPNCHEPMDIYDFIEEELDGNK